MDHTKSDSSAIKLISYDLAKREMRVQFRGGRTYSYTDVDPEDHQAFVDADSHGAHFNSTIRAKYEGQLIK